MGYGLKVEDTIGNILKVTPSVPIIISAGSLIAPDELKNDNTYGVDVSLLGNNSVADSDVGVLIDRGGKASHLDMHGSMAVVGNAGDTYMLSWYMKGIYDFNYFTRNEVTGVMSSWTPGDHSSLDLFDELLSAYPDAFWDKLGESEFINVRLFSAMVHHVYDKSVNSWINAFAFGTEGVEGIDYAVYMRYYEGGKNYIQD